MIFLYPLIVLVISATWHFVNGGWCDAVCECTNTFISTAESSTQIGCSGFQSCMDATLQSSYVSNNINSINCDGSESCANANINIIYAADVSCYGYASCINANIILKDCDSNKKSNVYCYSKQSCMNTSIYLGNATQINCYSIYSCANSNMTLSSFAKVYNYAYYGMINTVIYSDKDTTSHIYLEFDYSGYNLTIFCHYTSICNIHCDSSLGCSGMYLVITNSSINYNTDNPVSKSNYHISNFCNNDWNDTDDNYNYKVKYNKINHNIYNNYEIKNSNSRCPTYILASVFESSYTNDVSTDDELSLVQIYTDAHSIECLRSFDDGPVCSESRLSTHNDYVTIECGGYESCKESNLTISHNENNIVCSGKLSCTSTLMSMESESKDNSNNNNNNNNIRHNNIFCFATHGCSSSTIALPMDSTSFNDSTSYNNSINTLNNDKYVYCASYSGCWKAKISNAEYVEISGHSSCSGSATKLANNSMMAAYSQNAISGANITTSNTGKTYILKLFGYQAATNATFYCYGKDICYIYCQGNGCYRFSIYCYGKCYVQCNTSGGTDCPIAVNGSWDSIIKNNYTNFALPLQVNTSSVSVIPYIDNTCIASNESENDGVYDTILVFSIAGGVCIIGLCCAYCRWFRGESNATLVCTMCCIFFHG